MRTRPDDYGKLHGRRALVESKRLGARGLKIPKGLGLGYPAPDGKHLLPIDDKGLDPLFEEAGALGMPVAIHIGDPKAFWQPPTPANERWDELQAHPEWSFYGPDIPPWQALYDAFERRVARHPKTTFIAVHFGDDPGGSWTTSRACWSTYPNFYIDTAARVPEMGRHDAREDARVLREVSGSDPVRHRHGDRRDRRDDMMFSELDGRAAAHARRRGAFLQVDVALLRDERQAVREPHARSSGERALEDRRHRPPRRDSSQNLPRKRRPRARVAAERDLSLTRGGRFS